MLKKIILHAAIGGTIFGLGIFVTNELRMFNLGGAMLYGGFFYGILSVAYILYKGALPHVKKKINEKEIAKAQENLLKYKQLFNEGILTEAEFTEKSQELKRKIL